MKWLLAGLTLMLAVPAAAAAPTRTSANCAKTSVPMTPLTDLGTRTYHGYRGGLYANGRNTPPQPYLKIGLAHAARIKPIDSSGSRSSQPVSSTTQWTALVRSGHRRSKPPGDNSGGGCDRQSSASITSLLRSGHATGMEQP